MLIVRDLSEDLGCRRLSVVDQVLGQIGETGRVEIAGRTSTQATELRHIERRVVL